MKFSNARGRNSSGFKRSERIRVICTFFFWVLLFAKKFERPLKSCLSQRPRKESKKRGKISTSLWEFGKNYEIFFHPLSWWWRILLIRKTVFIENLIYVVTFSPLNSSEKNQRSWSVVDTPNSREVVAKENASATSRTKKFTFDRVFGPSTQQNDVYKSVVGPLIKEVLQGYNCTVFAYGQTGTGKTFTMEGIRSNPELKGIIPNSFAHIFRKYSRNRN